MTVTPRTDNTAVDNGATMMPDMGRIARAALASVADGNGLRADQIRLVREDSTLVRLSGEINIGFSCRLEVAHAPPPQDAVPVTSREAAQALADAHSQTLALNPVVLALLQDEINRLPHQGWACTPRAVTLAAHDSAFSLHDPATNTTQILIARSGADVSFTLWRQGADPHALEAADSIGFARLADEDLADIVVSPLEVDGTRLRAPCLAALPLAQVDFSLEGRFVSALVAGKQPRIVALEPVMDKFLKPGIAALLKLSRGPLAVDSLVSMAMKYRLVRQTLQALLLHSRKAVYHKLRRDYPIGVSDKYLRAAVRYAAAAHAALMVEPRKRGLRLGVLLSGAIALIYFIGLRPLITTAPIALAVDGGLWAALSLITVTIVRLRARQQLVAIIRAPKAPAQLPSAGAEGRKAPALIALMILIAAALAPEPPVYARMPAQLFSTYVLAPLSAP